MRRSKPLKRSGGLKKTPLRRVSKKQRKRNEEYTELRRDFLEAHPLCGVCHRRKATEVHHTDGRGERTNATNTWLGCCRPCHQRIHFGASEGYGPAWAREQGYLK